MALLRAVPVPWVLFEVDVPPVGGAETAAEDGEAWREEVE